MSLLFREPTQVRKGSKEKNITMMIWPTTTNRIAVVVNVDDEHYTTHEHRQQQTTLPHLFSLTFAVNAIFFDIILIYEWRNLDGFFLVFTLCSIPTTLHSSGWLNVNVMLFRSMMWEACSCSKNASENNEELLLKILLDFNMIIYFRKTHISSVRL